MDMQGCLSWWGHALVAYKISWFASGDQFHCWRCNCPLELVVLVGNKDMWFLWGIKKGMVCLSKPVQIQIIAPLDVIGRLQLSNWKVAAWLLGGDEELTTDEPSSTRTEGQPCALVLGTRLGDSAIPGEPSSSA